jgi:hypothetical protein
METHYGAIAPSGHSGTEIRTAKFVAAKPIVFQRKVVMP